MTSQTDRLVVSGLAGIGIGQLAYLAFRFIGGTHRDGIAAAAVGGIGGAALMLNQYRVPPVMTSDTFVGPMLP